MLWTAHDQKSSIKLLKDNVKTPFHRWHITVEIGAPRRFGVRDPEFIVRSDLRCVPYVTIVSYALELDAERVLPSDAILRRNSYFVSAKRWASVSVSMPEKNSYVSLWCAFRASSQPEFSEDLLP